MTTRDEHLFGPGPKRILSLDGGGVRGLITLGMLRKVEEILRARVKPHLRERFRLCDYFDLIGGTSTGALIATLLALGYRVDDVIEIYKDLAPKVFGKSRLFQGLIKSKFDGRALQVAIDGVLADALRLAGRNPADVRNLQMKSELLRTGLAIFAKRIDRGSVWALTNNPKSKYWDPLDPDWAAHFDAYGTDRDFYPNSDYSLADIVRASASAPFYLDGIGIDISPNQRGHFLDGGVSPFNNPAQELFLMTTLRPDCDGWHREGVSPHGFKWETGADKLFLLSLGTGEWRLRLDGRAFEKQWTLQQAKTALLSIIDDASLAATVWLQALSDSPKPSHINANLEHMRGLRVVKEPLLSFRRVNAKLEHEWLASLDLNGIRFKYTPGVIQKTRELDHSAAANLQRLLDIGVATGARDIGYDDFPAAFDTEDMRGVRLFSGGHV